MKKQRTLFCNLNPTCYAISQQKGILTRKLKDLPKSRGFAKERRADRLPVVLSEYSCHLIKRGPGVDPVLQQNKAVNIRLACAKLDGLLIRPGQEFSFWRTVGKTSKKKGYLDGRVIEHGSIVAGTGGGLCNLGNTIHLLVLHSPLTVTEIHHHSDALAPDEGPRVPFSAGTSVCYNYIDFRFRNDTDQTVQLHLWTDEDNLYGELLGEKALPLRYALSEEGHHFR